MIANDYGIALSPRPLKMAEEHDVNDGECWIIVMLHIITTNVAMNTLSCLVAMTIAHMASFTASYLCKVFSISLLHSNSE